MYPRRLGAWRGKAGRRATERPYPPGWDLPITQHPSFLPVSPPRAEAARVLRERTRHSLVPSPVLPEHGGLAGHVAPVVAHAADLLGILLPRLVVYVPELIGDVRGHEPLLRMIVPGIRPQCLLHRILYIPARDPCDHLRDGYAEFPLGLRVRHDPFRAHPPAASRRVVAFRELARKTDVVRGLHTSQFVPDGGNRDGPSLRLNIPDGDVDPCYAVVARAGSRLDCNRRRGCKRRPCYFTLPPSLGSSCVPCLLAVKTRAKGPVSEAAQGQQDPGHRHALLDVIRLNHLHHHSSLSYFSFVSQGQLQNLRDYGRDKPVPPENRAHNGQPRRKGIVA